MHRPWLPLSEDGFGRLFLRFLDARLCPARVGQISIHWATIQHSNCSMI